jgi:haloacetate dehalogenase
VTGGNGPPLLLLHGYPQTHLMWRKLAPRLAEEFTVVIPDLRGYGDSSKPPAGADNVGYSKRALALDQVETMKALGFERFAVAGHDRGGARVTHRLARDHPESVERLALLDIVPTLYRFETIDQKAATSSWHWFFLIQPSGFPERLMGSEAEFFLRHQLSVLLRDPAKLEPEAFAEYLRCFRNPETIRATCDEYRAGASIDLTHDRVHSGRKLTMPLLMLWGQRSSQGSGYDALSVWRDHADNVTGQAIPSGHFLPEEAPEETTKRCGASSPPIEAPTVSSRIAGHDTPTGAGFCCRCAAEPPRWTSANCSPSSPYLRTELRQSELRPTGCGKTRLYLYRHPSRRPFGPPQGKVRA